MSKMTTVKQMADKAHATAVEKGWWHQDRSLEDISVLIISELCEALDAWRKGKYFDSNQYGLLEDFVQTGGKDDVQRTWYKEAVKPTLSAELADAAIRILDICGRSPEIYMSSGMEKEPFDSIQKSPFLLQVEERHFIDYLYPLIQKLCPDLEGIYADDHGHIKCYEICLYEIFAVAEAMSINLPIHIRAKMAYNEGRAYRHGNLKA